MCLTPGVCMLQRPTGTNFDELLSNSARSFDGPDKANGMECEAPLVGRGISRFHKSLRVADIRELAQRTSRHRFERATGLSSTAWGPTSMNITKSSSKAQIAACLPHF